MNKETYYYYLYYLFMLLFSTLCRLKIPNCSLFLSLFTRDSYSDSSLTFSSHFFPLWSYLCLLQCFIIGSQRFFITFSLSVALFLCLSSWSSLAHLLLILYTQIWPALKEFDLLKLSRLSPFPLFPLPSSLLPLLPSHFSPLLSTLLAPHLLSLNPRQAFSAAAPWPPL